MTDLSTFAELASVDHGLCVFSTLRGDGSAQASVVNAGVLQHPLTGVQVVGLVATGAARKLRNLRADPRATIVARAGWRWAAAAGSAQLIGLDDPHPDVNDEQLRLLLRAVFTASWWNPRRLGHRRRVMREERRTAVLVPPTRVYSSPA